jgi:nucleoid-associated protein YgaU
MTRETRIGLLIGLGFIVLFGVVLAGLLNTNDKLPAPNAASGNSTLAFDPIREEVPAPRTEPPVVVARPTDPVPGVVPADPRVAGAPAGPTQPVEVVLEGPGSRIASVGEATPSEIVRGREALVTPPPSRPEIPVLVAGGQEIPTIASVDRGPAGSTVASPDQIPSLKYKIAAGDTLGKLAVKFYGHSSDYKLILTANSSLRDATSLKIGQEIMIPPAPVRVAVAPVAPAAPATPAVAVVRTVDAQGLRRVLAGSTRGADHAAATTPRVVTPAPTNGVSGTGLAADPAHGDLIETPMTPGSAVSSTSGATIAARMRATMGGTAVSPATPALVPTVRSGPDAAKKVYEIQQGDTLSKIASKMMKDSSRAAIQKIIDLNKGKISSPESLKIGVKLEIPS